MSSDILPSLEKVIDKRKGVTHTKGPDYKTWKEMAKEEIHTTCFVKTLDKICRTLPVYSV